jgi:hypothetical protein
MVFSEDKFISSTSRTSDVSITYKERGAMRVEREESESEERAEERVRRSAERENEVNRVDPLCCTGAH